MLSGSGEPNLSFYKCRFIVYISTFAKPIGLYLTLLFSIERIFKKILSNFILCINNYRLLFKKFYLLFIFFGINFILSIRLYEVFKFVQIYQSKSNSSITSRKDMSNDDNDDDNTNNSTDPILNFQYCYRSMNFETYAKILSFYIIQYWFEYTILAIIILILLCFIIYQYFLPYIQHRPSSHLSINTKFYLSLSSCVILSELILQFLHIIVDAVENNNSDIQVNYLQMMLFVYNFRCIILPFIICLISCDSLKQWLYEFFIRRSYLDNFNENDQTNQSESFSSTQQTFAKNNNNEHFDMRFNSHI
jgi:hypothetical protein